MRLQPSTTVLCVLACSAAALAAVIQSGSITERDRTRLAAARQTHGAEVERATNAWRVNVDRANRALERAYADLIERCERRGDTETAESLRTELRDAIASTAAPGPDAAQAAAPASPPPAPAGFVELRRMIGDTLVDARGSTVPADRIAGNRYVLLYFSAGWCGPCKAFTPQLAQFYTERGAKAGVEVIFISSDRSADEMAQYMQGSGMPWLAVPYARVAETGIKAKWAARGIPHAVLLGPDGKVLSASQQPDSNKHASDVLQDLRKLVG